MAQEKKSKPPKQETEEVSETEAKDVQNEELSDETDDLLADIDDVLEENAQEFVKGYVQQGGE